MPEFLALLAIGLWRGPICGSPHVLSAATAILMARYRPARRNRMIVAQFCVQVRKIAMRITMAAIATMETFVSVKNVRYICS